MGAFSTSLLLSLYLSLYTSSAHSFLCHTISCASVKVYLKYISHGCTHTPTGTHTHRDTYVHLGNYTVQQLIEFAIWPKLNYEIPFIFCRWPQTQRASERTIRVQLSPSFSLLPSLSYSVIYQLLNEQKNYRLAGHEKWHR